MFAEFSQISFVESSGGCKAILKAEAMRVVKPDFTGIGC